MDLSLYPGLLLNFFLIKPLILFNISEYFLNISLLLTKRFMYLLFLSKHLVNEFIWGSFIDSGDGKTLLLYLYPIKYLHESLLYDFSGDNTIYSISTYLILMGHLFFLKAQFMMPFSPKYTASCSIFYTVKRKKSISLF